MTDGIAFGEELVRNGDFSTHQDLKSGNWGTMRDTGDDAWRATQGVIEIQLTNGKGGVSKHGEAVLELDSAVSAYGGSNSSVTQVIDAPADGVYRLSFDHAPRARSINDLEASSSFRVYAGGELVAEIAEDQSGWRSYDFDIPLTAGPVELTFEATGKADGYGALIDNVSVRAVEKSAAEPEPEVETTDAVPDFEFGEDLIQNGDFEEHVAFKGRKKAVQDIGDGSWTTDDAPFEVFEGPNINGTPYQMSRTAVLELDSHRRVAENSNSDVSQIVDIDGPGTFLLELDYAARIGRGKGHEGTAGAEIWLGDKLVAVLDADQRGWRRESIEIELTEDDLPEGPVALRFVGTGDADNRGAMLDNITLREIDANGDEGPELVANGDFSEHAAYTNGNKGYYDSVDGGWTAAEGTAIELREVRKVLDVRDADNSFIELDGVGRNSNASATQVVDIPEEGSYRLSFDYSPRSRNNTDTAETSGVRVTIGGELVAEFSSGDVGWITYDFNVDLDAGPVDLVFEGVGLDDRRGALIDNVSLRQMIPTNQAPQAGTAEFFVDEDTETVIDLLDGATDADGDALNLVDVSAGPGAVISLNENGEAVVTPDENFSGEVEVTYAISDGNGAVTEATAILTVRAVNDDPNAYGDMATTDENTSVTFDLLANDTDIEGDKLFVIDVPEEVDGGVVTDHGDGSVTFTPDAGFDGLVAFSYTISDGNGGTDTETALIVVYNTNDAPTAADDLAETNEGAAVTINLLGNDTDPDGDALHIVDLPLDVDGGDVSDLGDGVIAFTPDEGFDGEASFTYTVSDGQGHTDTATVRINVLNVNEGPDAQADQVATEQDVAVTFDLLANDDDPDGDALTVIELPTVLDEGALTDNGDGTVTFTPLAGFSGEVTFSYTVSDGNGATDTAMVAIDVISVNEAPVALDDIVSVAEDGSVTVDLIANDADPNGDLLSIIDVDAGSDGAAEINAGGTITFTPSADFEGETSFTYTISDGAGLTDTATVFVTVTPENDAPTTVSDTASTQRDSDVVVKVLNNDDDVDLNDELTLVEVTTTRGVVTIDDNRVRFDPAADFEDLEKGEQTTETVTYRVRDIAGAEAVGVLVVTVKAPHDDEVTDHRVFQISGSKGTVADPVGESVLLSVTAETVTGMDNTDDLSIDLTASGGKGRLGVSGAKGANDTNTAGGLAEGEDGGDGTASGAGGSAEALATAAEIHGEHGADVMALTVDARGGDGVSGGKGGQGGRTQNLGQHVTQNQDSQSTLTYDGGTGGDGGDGGDGSDGGDGLATVDAAVMEGGFGDDEIQVEASARGGRGGGGGDGGRGGVGGYAEPAGGPGGYDVRSGDGGNGASGGDAVATIQDSLIDGGDGDDVIELVVDAQGGDAGDGGSGGKAANGAYRDTLDVIENGFLVDTDGYVENQYGAAGDGGDSATGGDATARLLDNEIFGGDGDDVILLEVEVSTDGQASGGSGGNGGSDSYFEKGPGVPYDIINHSGVEGADGAASGVATARVEIVGNLVDGGEGADTFLLELDVSASGPVVYDIRNNSFVGGDGIDTIDFSDAEVSVDVDLGGGQFSVAGGGSNSVSEVENVIGSDMDDVIAGSAADNTLTGGDGVDRFVFTNGGGADIITDFKNGDLIDLSGHSSVDEFDDLVITKVDTDTVITGLSGDLITLKSVSANTLDNVDFVF